MTIKVGIIGLGKIGERHVNAYANIPGVELKGFCDIDPTLLKNNPQLSNVPIFDNANFIINDPDIDVVDICIPTKSHHEIILQALENGKHVFCEKPLTHKKEYADQIKKAAKKFDRLVMVGYLYRFHPSFELLRDVLNKGIIGNPYYAIFRIGGRGGHRAWKHKVEDGGGAILDMMTHMLDLALCYFGNFEMVKPIFSEVLRSERIIDGKTVKVDAEDCIFIVAKTKTVQVFIEADLITPSFMNIVEVHGDNGSFIGSITTRIPTVLYLIEPRDIYDRGETVFNFPQINLIEKELQYFINCIQRSETPLNSLDDSITTSRIIEDIRRQIDG